MRTYYDGNEEYLIQEEEDTIGTVHTVQSRQNSERTQTPTNLQSPDIHTKDQEPNHKSYNADSGQTSKNENTNSNISPSTQAQHIHKTAEPSPTIQSCNN